MQTETQRGKMKKAEGGETPEKVKAPRARTKTAAAGKSSGAAKKAEGPEKAAKAPAKKAAVKTGAAKAPVHLKLYRGPQFATEFK